MSNELYQLEVKRILAEHCFSPDAGWNVTIDIDGMERGLGSHQRAEKRERAQTAEKWLRAAGVTIRAHPTFARADLIAERPGELVVAEVEGRSRRQPDQALYSALGQLLLNMDFEEARFLLAVPESPTWRRQAMKISPNLQKRLSLDVCFVSVDGILSL